MAGKTQVMRDFSAGVVNQELQNRDDGRGVFIDAKNVISSWNGELSRRTGTHWVRTLTTPSRIIPFRKPDGNDIILLISNGMIEGYVFADNEHIEPYYVPGGAVPTFPTSGWTGVTTNGDYTITISSDAAQTDWGKGFNDATGVQKYYQQGSLYTGGYTSTANTEATVDISSTTAQTFQSCWIRWCNTCKGNHKGHYKGWVDPIIQYSDDGTNWTSVATNVKNPYGFGGASEYRASYVYGSGSNTKTENYIVYQVTNVDHMSPHQYWRIKMRLRVANNQTYSNERIDLFVQKVTYTAATMVPLQESSTFFTDENLEDIKFAQYNTTMILTNGTDPALQIEYSAGGLTIATQVNSLNYGSEGYPKCVTFFQNRLFFGGFSAEPTKVWGSAFGNFADFTIPTPVLSTSPLDLTCVEIKSIIENLWGSPTALYALSEDGVSMIDAAGGIVATDQVEFKLRNREPVNGMTPTVKNDVMVYLGRDKQKIFVTDYDLVVQRFRATNISKKYSNFLAAGVKEMHFIPDRTDLVYGILEDGKMFGLLFDPEQQVDGLFPMETNGFINDIQPIKYQDNTKLCMLVQRAGVWQLEYKENKPMQSLMDFMSEDEKKAYSQSVLTGDIYLDCATKRHYEPATSIIGDLPYIAGQDVEVYADGRYIGHKTLSTSTDSGLYAWKYSIHTIYTLTPTPTTSSLVYDENGEQLPGYVITAVSGSTITIMRHVPRHVSYHGYAYSNKIYVDVTADSPAVSYKPPVGRRWFNRSPAASVEHPTYIWEPGWRSDDGYEVRTANEYGWLFLGSFANVYANFGNIRQGSVLIDERTVKYTREAIPNLGDDVFNDDMTLYGTVTSRETISYAGNTYYKIETSEGTHFYKSLANDIVVQEEETIYETYSRYSDGDRSFEGVALLLDFEVSDITVGLPYQAYAAIKLVTPYMIRKFPREIAVNFINTGYLELGNTFNDLQPVLDNLAETITLDNMPVLLNGNYEKTLDKQAFETPYIIVHSNVGMPFIVTGIDYEVDYSNYQGGV